MLCTSVSASCGASAQPRIPCECLSVWRAVFFGTCWLHFLRLYHHHNGDGTVTGRNETHRSPAAVLAEQRVDMRCETDMHRQNKYTGEKRKTGSSSSPPSNATKSR